VQCFQRGKEHLIVSVQSMTAACWSLST